MPLLPPGQMVVQMVYGVLAPTGQEEQEQEDARELVILPRLITPLMQTQQLMLPLPEVLRG